MSGYEETVKEREDEEIDLGILFRNFFQGLLRFWWLIAILMLVGGYGMYARATRFYTPRYRSTASFRRNSASLVNAMGEESRMT